MSQRQLRRGFRPGRRPKTCYHEAGHCLARWWFGHSFDRVLVLTTKQVAQGIQPLNRRGVPMSDVEGFMDAYDLMPFLTPAMLDGMGGEPDALARMRQHARASVEMSLIECHIGAAAEAHYCKCSVMVALWMGGNGDMAQLGRTLDAWYPDPDARAAADIQAAKRTAALVRSEAGWRAITAVASALMDKGELQWSEAEPLLAAAYGHARPNPNTWMETWPPSLAMIRAGRFPEQESAE